MDLATVIRCRQHLLCHMEPIPVILRYVPNYGNQYFPKTLEGWRICPGFGSPVPWVDTNIRTFQVMPLMWPDQYADPSFLLPYYAAEQGIILLPDAINHLMSGPQMDRLTLTHYNVAYEFAPPEPYCSVHTAYLAKPFLYNEWRNYIDRYFPGLIQPGGQLPVTQPGPSQMAHLEAMRHDERSIGDLQQQQQMKQQRMAHARQLKHELCQRVMEEQAHQRQVRDFVERQKLVEGQKNLEQNSRTEKQTVSEAVCQPKTVVGEERQRQIPKEEEPRQRELEEHAHWERQHKAFAVRQEGRDKILQQGSLPQEWNQTEPDEHRHREGQELKRERALQEANLQKMLMEKRSSWNMGQREEYPLELGYQAGQAAQLMQSKERVEGGHRKCNKESDREQQEQECQELELQKQIATEQQSSDCSLIRMPVRNEDHQERERREPMAKERRSEWYYQWKMDKEKEFECCQMPIPSRKNQQEQGHQQKVDKERELERLLSQTSIWKPSKKEDGQNENQQ